MFNSDYIFDPSLVEMSATRRQSTSFPNRFSESPIPQQVVVRQETAHLRKQLQQRRKIWNSKPTNQPTGGKEIATLRTRARSLIQLPPNINTYTNGFFPFSDLNSKNRLEVKVKVNDFPVRRQFIKTHPMKQIVTAEMMFNKSQAASIQNFNQQVFKQTVVGFEAFYKRRLSSLDISKKKVKVRSIEKRDSSYKPEETTLEFNEEVFYGNRQRWKPAIGEDSIILYQEDKVYYFGGRNRSIPMPVYNMQSLKWKEQSQLKQCYFLTGTYGHFYKGKQVLFGGEYPILNARTKTLTNKIFNVNLEAGEMEELQVREAIEARRCHASCIYGNYYMCFGGISTNYTFLSELCALDLVAMEWQDIEYTCSSEMLSYLQNGVSKFKMLPVFNTRASMSLYDSNSPQLTDVPYLQEGLYLFGGLNQLGNALRKLLVITLGQFSPRVIEPKIKGTPPEARYDYGICRWHNSIVIHGGRNDQRNPHIYNDCYMLNLLSLYWTKVILSDLNERYCHQLIVRGKEEIWLFGGKDLKGHTKDVACYSRAVL